jgi:hypothetical protein
MPGTSTRSGKEGTCKIAEIAPLLRHKQPQRRVQCRDDREVKPVEHRDHAAVSVSAIEPVGRRQQNDRQQEDGVKKDDRATRFGLSRESAVMAEPEHAGNDKAQHQSEQPCGIEVVDFGPARRVRKLSRARQIIGKQGHGHAENGVAQRFQPAHFEMVGGPFCHV